MPPIASRESNRSDAFYLTSFSEKDKPWDKHRSVAVEVEKLYTETFLDSYARRINKCSEWLTFHFKVNETGEVALKLKDARFCRVRHCPVCQWRRSMMWRARFFESIPKVLTDYPKARFIFLTLTVKNCSISELKQTIAQMNLAWRRLTDRASFPAIGFVRSLEVTKGYDQTAHPHFHCILMVPGGYFGGKQYVSQAKWTEMWKSCLRIDYTPVVNVKAIKPDKNVITTKKLDEKSPIVKAILETIKYSVKEGDLQMDAQWLAELTTQLHKTRAISVGGILKEYIKEEEPEDLINTEIQEELEEETEIFSITFGWRETIQRYVSRLHNKLDTHRNDTS